MAYTMLSRAGRRWVNGPCVFQLFMYSSLPLLDRLEWTGVLLYTVYHLHKTLIYSF